MSIKFEWNTPIDMTFKYDGPREVSGINGKYWSYGVGVGGAEDYLNASQGLVDILSMRGKLKGKTLRITKLGENGRFINWTVTDPDSSVSASVGMPLAQEEAQKISAEIKQQTGEELLIMLKAKALQTADVHAVVIERLKDYQALFGENFSAVVNTCLMETFKRSK